MLLIAVFVFTLEHKLSTNNTKVSMELHLLFPDLCMSKLIWLHRVDEETASSLHAMKNCNFFFWIGVLQLPRQHYTHPVSCWVLRCLQWQHRCWSWAAWWLSGNVSTEWWHSFSMDFKHGRAPDWTKREPNWLPDTGLDFLRASLQLEMSGSSDCISEHQSRIWCHTSLCSGAHFGSTTVHSLCCYFPSFHILGPHCFYLCNYPVPHVDLGKTNTRPQTPQTFWKTCSSHSVESLLFLFICNVLSSEILYWILYIE